MTDISKKIEAALDDYFGFCDNHAGIDKQEAVEGITKIIEEERAGWVEGVIEKILSLPDERGEGTYRMVNAHTLVCWLQDIRNSKEKV